MWPSPQSIENIFIISKRNPSHSSPSNTYISSSRQQLMYFLFPWLPSFVSLSVINTLTRPQLRGERVYVNLGFQCTVHHCGEDKAGSWSSWSYHVHSQEQRDINACTWGLSSLSLLYSSSKPKSREWLFPQKLTWSTHLASGHAQVKVIETIPHWDSIVRWFYTGSIIKAVKFAFSMQQNNRISNLLWCSSFASAII